MRKRIVHIVLFCLALACPVLLAVSCADGAEWLQQQDADGQTVQMVLRVSAADIASASGYTPVNERMHTLHIIVLGESGTVERNLFIDFSDEPRMEYQMVLELVKSEQKKIYLIANERSIEGLYDVLKVQTVGVRGFEELVNGFTFVPDYTQPLPMTSCYTVSIGEETHIEKTFHVVYAASKFNINFVNNRDRDVTVRSFTLSAPASSMYLMPHLDEKAGVYKAGNDGKGVKTPFVIDGRDGELDWIDWLKYIAEESQTNQSDGTLADRRGWILEYAIPQESQQDAAHDLLQATNNGSELVLAKGKTTDMPAFYLPESKNLTANSIFAPGLEQEYMMNLVLAEKHGDGISTRTISDIRLPNLRALFRNTHVKVNISIESNILNVVVDLVPYTSKELKPVFGLDVQP